MKRLFFVALSIFLLSGSSVFSGTTGKIAGKVTDAETGDPLPGANVILEGTTMGAATSLDGDYVILNVPPGTSTVKATMIGYGDFIVSNVRVNIDLTTTVNFEMKPTVLAFEVITVVAKRPVVFKDISASQAHIEAAQVAALPVQRIQQVIGLQAGIVGSVDGGIQIRGGGQDEIAFMIDGFTLRDERNNRPYTSIPLSSIQDIQVQTGGFNAEYGNIRSGLVNVVTKEGSAQKYSATVTTRFSPARAKNFGPSPFDPDSYWTRPFLDPEVAWTGTGNGAWDLNTQRQFPSFVGWNAVSEQTLQDDDPNNDLTPQAAQELWKWEHRRQGDINDPDYTIDLGFSGPVPIVSKSLGDLSFFFSHRREQDAYLVNLSRDTFNDEIYLLKLTSNINPNLKLTISGLYGQLNTVSRSQIGLPNYFRSTSSVAAELSQRSFIESILWVPDYFAPTRIRRYNVSAKLTHVLSNKSFYEVQVERTANFYHTFPGRLRDTEKIVRVFGENVGVNEAPFGFMPFPSSGQAGFRMGVGMSQSRDSTRISTTAFRGDFTSQVNHNNQVKAGVELIINDHDAQFGGVDLTLPAGRPNASWKRKPVRGSIYAQDKIEFRGLIANLGLRLDYAHAGGNVFDIDIYDRGFLSSNYVSGSDSAFNQVATEHQLYISPRLGISHPITDNSKLFFNYGHFYSMPEAERLYNIQRTNDGSVQRLGNPDLKMSRTRSYEIGFEQDLFDRDSKVNYRLAEDNLYQDVRGLELTLSKNIGSLFSGFVNYTYFIENTGFFGKRQLFENPAEQRAADREENRQSKPSPRPFFRSNLVFDTPKDLGPAFLGSNPLGDWRISFLINWRAGAHVTWARGLDPNDLSNVDIRNNVQRPDFFAVDLRLSRTFHFAGHSMRFFVDVNNLFNNKVFNYTSAFSDGTDFRDYMDSLLWPESIGKPLGYTVFGDDKIGDLRPDNVAYDALEINLNNDPEIEARNKKRRDTKSYIDNPNQKWLYYLNRRDVYFGLTYEF
jgi:outer membrane receptor protein involved in Fe transport